MGDPRRRRQDSRPIGTEARGSRIRSARSSFGLRNTPAIASRRLSKARGAGRGLMRRFASLLILLAGACENGHPPHRAPPQNTAEPATIAPPPARALPAANTAGPATVDVPAPDDPRVA